MNKKLINQCYLQRKINLSPNAILFFHNVEAKYKWRMTVENEG